jgi:predicted ATPase/DNA-binding CsgD family transcriptional regulator/Tfp pilus assembly protein PilF
LLARVKRDNGMVEQIPALGTEVPQPPGEVIAAAGDAPVYAVERSAPGKPLRRARDSRFDPGDPSAAGIHDAGGTNTPGLSATPVRPLTTFVGRVREFEEVVRLLGRSRLLTLTGAGGSGKTRLALEAAEAVAETFPDGVVVVSLAALQDPALVLPAMAQALGVRTPDARPLLDALKARLRDARLLMILDSFDRFRDAAAVLPDLLHSSPGLVLLVTSRSVLRVSAEQEYPVPPLDLPPAQSTTLADITRWDAVRLFVDRVGAVKPDFELSEENARTIADVCRRLDGLPLAIELAAAWIRLLPLDAMLARLQRHRLLLTGGPKDYPTRQQTLRDTIAWSHDLLDERERALFRRLAVFAGGASLEATEYLYSSSQARADDVLPLLDGLLQKNVIRQVAAAGEPRFDLLETIREFALEQLDASGEAEAVRRAHASYFLQLSEAAAQRFHGREQVTWLSRLEAEHDNLRTVLELLEAGTKNGRRDDAGALVRACAALWWFWLVRGHAAQGRRWLRVALSLDPGTSPVWGEALFGAGMLAWAQADYAQARELFERARQHARALDDSRLEARALTGLGITATRTWASDACLRLEEALALLRSGQDVHALAWCLDCLGVALRESAGDHAGGRRRLEESLALYRELGDAIGTATALGHLGTGALRTGDLDAAWTHMDEAVRTFRSAGDRYNEAMWLNTMGTVAAHRGDNATARPLFEQSLAMRRELGDMHGMAWSLGALATLSRDEGDLAGAAALYSECLALKRTLGDRVGILPTLTNLGAVAIRRGALDEAEDYLREAWPLLESCADERDLARILTTVADLCEARGMADPVASLRSLAATVQRNRTTRPAPEHTLAVSRAFALLPATAPSAAHQAPGRDGQDHATPHGAPARARRRGSPDELTAREQEVARLVASGLTNRQIADALVITPRTAELHVQNVLGKLGFHTRAQIAAWAVGHGLRGLRLPE